MTARHRSSGFSKWPTIQSCPSPACTPPLACGSPDPRHDAIGRRVDLCHQLGAGTEPNEPGSDHDITAEDASRVHRDRGDNPVGRRVDVGHRSIGLVHDPHAAFADVQEPRAGTDVDLRHEAAVLRVDAHDPILGGVGDPDPAEPGTHGRPTVRNVVRGDDLDGSGIDPNEHAPEQSSPSAIAQMPPSPAPMLDSPSAGTSTATHPVTVPVSGSMRATPRSPHVAVHTAPNPESMPAHGDCGTATEPRGRPVRTSNIPIPRPTPLTHARPESTRTQSASEGARKACASALRTLVIGGSSGTAPGEGGDAFAAVGLAPLVRPAPALHAAREVATARASIAITPR